MEQIKKREKDFPPFSRLFLFRGVSGGLARAAFEHEDCACMAAESGETVYSRTAFHQSMGFVLSGELKAYKAAADSASLVMNGFCSGGVFGVAGMFHEAEGYVCDIIAEKRSRILFIPQTLLCELMHKNAVIAENYISYLSGRICFLNHRIDSLVGGSAEVRLACILLELCAENPEEDHFQLPFPLTELAGRLNLGRASLYRAFHILEEDGILKKEGKQIIILDRKRLRLLGHWYSDLK